MEELDLKDLLSLFLSKIAQIILITTISVVIGIIYTLGFTTPKYTSSTTLILTGSNQGKGENTITTSDVTLNSKLVSTYSVLAKSKSVLGKVISNLNLNINQGELKKGVSVTAVEDTEVIKISVTNEDPELARKLANEVAIVFCDKVTEHYGMNNIHILDEAEVPQNPSNIHHTKDVAIFAFIGIAISIGYVLIANMLDTTIKTQEEIEKGFGLPVLVSIPMIDSFNVNKGGKK